MIKNLIFDFGKVLVNHDLQPLLERHFGDDEVSLIGFHKILSDPEFINMCDRGIIPFEKMIDGAIKRYPEYSDAFTFFKDNYLEEITGEIEGMRVLLKKLGNYILLYTITKIIKGHITMYPFIIQSFFSFFFPFPSFLTLQERVFRKRGSRGSIFGL